MNIVRAGEEIKNTVKAYLARKEDGSFVIPPEKQRPLLLIGPPGIGKTAILRQVAEETGVGLVSYSMTHHTRQSAIGLPYITDALGEEDSVKVTRYTMSEIIASILDYIKETGKKEGILFLDEINCVSETLTPLMLQLLQQKTFGTHPIPENWILVTAGNPAEYNASVKEFDMVTLDRVRRMDIEADLGVWMDYAEKHDVHPLIRAYLTACPGDFYVIEENERGLSYVTARGWDDLSDMLKFCDETGTPVDEELILEYISHDRIARSFCSFLRTAASLGKSSSSFEELTEDLSDEKLNGLTVKETMCLSAVMFSDLKKNADIWEEADCFIRRREELLKRSGKPEELIRIIGNIRESLSDTKKSVKELVREKKLLDMTEDAAADLLIGEDGCLRLTCAMKEASMRDESIREAAAEKTRELYGRYCSVLSKCANGNAALLYLKADTENDGILSKILGPEKQDHPKA